MGGTVAIWQIDGICEVRKGCSEELVDNGAGGCFYMDRGEAVEV